MRAQPRNYDLPPGAHIPGSRYQRAYCWACGEPMRVPDYCPRRAYFCQECQGRPHHGAGSRLGNAAASHDARYHGRQAVHD